MEERDEEREYAEKEKMKGWWVKVRGGSTGNEKGPKLPVLDIKMEYKDSLGKGIVEIIVY